MEQFPDALAVLSAMITPAVLISACGPLILATSDRLSKAVVRPREVSDQLKPRPEDDASMDFIWKRGKESGPEDLVKKGMKDHTLRYRNAPTDNATTDNAKRKAYSRADGPKNAGL